MNMLREFLKIMDGCVLFCVMYRTEIKMPRSCAVEILLFLFNVLVAEESEP